jgi:hypothetical protein
LAAVTALRAIVAPVVIAVGAAVELDAIAVEPVATILAPRDGGGDVHHEQHPREAEGDRRPGPR